MLSSFDINTTDINESLLLEKNTDDSDSNYDNSDVEPKKTKLLNFSFISNPTQSSAPKSYIRSKSCRALMLIVQCLMVVGRYYAYDNPQALEVAIKTDLGVDNFAYNLLYSVYSIPNIIIPFVGGFIVDYYGARVGIFVFTSVVFLGQGIVWLGGSTEKFWVIIFGRIIFGVGGELIEVAHQNLAVKWFRNQLGLAIGLGMSFSRIGSAANSFFTPKLYQESGTLSLPFMVSFVLCGFSWLVGLFVIYVDYKSDEQEGLLDKTEKIMENEKKLCKFEEVKRFAGIFWLLVLSCSLSYGCVMGFLNISNDYISERFGFNSSDSGNIITLYYVVSMALTPLFGRFVDKFGKRARLMLISSVIFIITLLGLTLIPDCNVCYYPIWVFLIMGIYMSIYGASFWPSIPLVIDSKYIGTAFGLIYSSLNFFNILMPIAVGWIKDNFNYLWVNVLLTIISIGTLIVALYLNKYDNSTGKRLNKSPIQATLIDDYN